MSVSNAPKDFESIKQSSESLKTTIKVSYGALILFSYIMFTFVSNIFQNIGNTNYAILLLLVISGMASADFFSGILHWTFDTWGSSEIPFWGEYVVKSFREHHTKPHLILKRNWIESNGVPIIVVVLVHVVYSLLFEEWVLSILGSVHTSVFLFCFYLMMSMSNEIHKLCHYPKECGYFVETLRLFKIIPSRMDHKKHHTYPFDDNYCLSTGWMNPILRKLNFWRNLERIITRITGLQPRSEDHMIYEALVKSDAREHGQIRKRKKE